VTDVDVISLLIITNAVPLREVIMRLARQSLPYTARILGLTYADCIRHLTPELVSHTGYFVLELFRQYPGGLRAEGVVLAQRVARQGKILLVISPLSLAARLSCRMYWDASSPDTLSDRLAQLVMLAKPDQSELERISRTFKRFLDLPPQHK